MGGERWGAPTQIISAPEAGKGKVTSEGESRYVQRNQHWAREYAGFSPVEKESGVVRTLRGVTNCPNIPATGPLWVRTPQLWESQQENRQTRLSFGRQINLASYLPGDNIAFPLEKQRPEISERGIGFCHGFPGEELATSEEQQAGLIPGLEFPVLSSYGAISLMWSQHLSGPRHSGGFGLNTLLRPPCRSHQPRSPYPRNDSPFLKAQM